MTLVGPSDLHAHRVLARHGPVARLRGQQVDVVPIAVPGNVEVGRSHEPKHARALADREVAGIVTLERPRERRHPFGVGRRVGVERA